MRRPVLIIADVHGNLEALKAVLKDAAGLYQHIWVLGDVAGYGPDPGPCLDMLRKLNAVMVAGNHDWAASGKMDIEEFNDEARIAAEIHRRVLTSEQKSFLSGLPEIIVRDSVTIAHGDPAKPIWGYVLDDRDAAGVLRRAETSLTLIGHTHLPGVWAYDSRSGARFISMEYNEELKYSGVPHLANPGSVGQSRDGDPAARYMILEPFRKTLSIHRCPWRTGPTRRKMKARGYPASLTDRMAPK
jgi:predicted phosphodiesterase